MLNHLADIRINEKSKTSSSTLEHISCIVKLGIILKRKYCLKPTNDNNLILKRRKR